MEGTRLTYLVKYTARSKPDWTVGSGFSSISPSNLDQISKSGTVLKSWERVDFKTVPDFGIWPRFDGEIEEKPDPTVQSGFNFAVCCLSTTPCPRKKSSVFISSFSPSNLGQIPKSRTVLKSAHSQLSKTVPDFEIWPTISWENWDWRYQVSMVWQKIIILLDKKAPLVSLISIFFAYSWSNFKIRDSFEKLRMCRFQNCPWFWNLTKIWWRYWGNKHWWLFLWTQCMS